MRSLLLTAILLSTSILPSFQSCVALTGPEAIDLATGTPAQQKHLNNLLRGNTRTASIAAWAVYKHPYPAAANVLVEKINSTDQVLAYWAIRALGSIGDTAAIAPLTALLANNYPDFWEQSQQKKGWMRLKGVLKNKNTGVPTHEFAPPEMPSLRAAYAALITLGELGSNQAAQTLGSYLSHDVYLIRNAAAIGLGAMKAQNKLQALRKLATQDPVLIVRQSANTAIDKITGAYQPPSSALPTLPDKLLFIKTEQRTESNLGFRDSYFFPKTPWYAGGQNLFLLTNLNSPTPKATNLTKLTGGGVQGPELSYDAKTVIFGMSPNTQTDGFHIFQMNVDGSNLKQLTFGNCNDVDPTYLPDGRIVFSSDRAGYREYYHQERSRILYSMNPDGSNIQPISFNPNQDYEPYILNTGQILYASYRFYAQDGSPPTINTDRGRHGRIETTLRTIQPDGSNDQPFYGAMRGAYYTPMRPMPETLQYSGWHPRGLHIGVSVSQQKQLPNGNIVCITPAGLTTIDPTLSPTDCEQPAFPEVLNLAGGEEVYIHNHDNMNPIGRFTTPYPATHLPTPDSATDQWIYVSHAPFHDLTTKAYGLYLFNLTTKQLKPLYDDPNFSDIDPLPVIPRPIPQKLASFLAPTPPDTTNPTGKIYCLSVFNSDLPYDQQRVKYVRVISSLTQPLSINANASFRTRELAVIPIQKDGSFYVEVPADTPIRFALLDADQKTIVHETAFSYVRPGETKGCIGCHEPKNAINKNTIPQAIHLPPASAIEKRGDHIYQGRLTKTYSGLYRD